jgi:hypothetical protein
MHSHPGVSAADAVPVNPTATATTTTIVATKRNLSRASITDPAFDPAHHVARRASNTNHRQETVTQPGTNAPLFNANLHAATPTGNRHAF